MKVQEILEMLDCQCYLGKEDLDREVYKAFGCDLMSDVLAFDTDKTLLLTGLTNNQVIRTAEMMDISVIIFVRGKKPTKEVVDLAKNNNMILLSTKHILYTACGILYEKGLKGVPRREEEQNI
ncbi:MAG: DRTGG domain-containing protein [Anaeromicrobium sp.]|nr:DRTGG domain-containing protein [Anaeromicrobium sp.]MCT4594931.1 DRTGG domain-containing protein [Anaeromicrobium sp.]